MKNTFSLKACIAVFTLLISQSAFAAPAGTVTFKTGDVSITRADKTVIKAEKNVALNAGDTIETGDGRLQLSLIDGGKVSLQPNTIYKINKYEFSGKEDGTEYGFTELVKGGLRTVSGLIGHKNRDRYQLKTAVATIGIRGTEFTVNFNNNQLLMTTNHGSVDVCNLGGCLNALSGQSIGVAGIGAKPKPSAVPATASVTPAAKKTAVATNETEDSKSDTKADSTKDSNADSSIKVVTKSDAKSDSSMTTEATTDSTVSPGKAEIVDSSPVKLDIDQGDISIADIGNSGSGKTDIVNSSPIKLDQDKADISITDISNSGPGKGDISNLNQIKVDPSNFISIKPSIDNLDLSNKGPGNTIDIINFDLSIKAL